MRLADVQFRSDDDGVVVARITGEIDLSNGEELGAALMDAISNDTLGLVVDLSEVEHLDSAGIQLIYRLRETLRARGQTLQLVIPGRCAAHDALRLAGASSHIQMAEAVEDAIGQLHENR